MLPRLGTASRALFRLLSILVALCGLILAAIVEPAPSSANTPVSGHWVKGVGIHGSQRGLWLGPDMSTVPGHWCVDMWSTLPSKAETVEETSLSKTYGYGPAEITLTLKELAWVITAYREDSSADVQAAIAYLVHVNLEQPSANALHPDPNANVEQLVEAVRDQLPTVEAKAQDLVKQAAKRTPEGGSFAVVKKSMGEQYQAVIQAQLTPPAVPPKFQPVAMSSVGEAHIVDDATLTDTIEVQADGTQEWPTIDGAPVPVKFQGTVFALGETLGFGTDVEPESAQQSGNQSGSQATSPSSSSNGSVSVVPADAKAVGSVILTANGPGFYQAELSGVEPGFYTWVWSVDRQQQTQQIIYDGAHVNVADMIVADWSDGYALPEETSSVRATVTVHTEATVVETDGVLVLTDSITASGFPQDHPNFAGLLGFEADVATMVSTLFFFPEGVEVLEDNLDQAVVVGEMDIPAENGHVTTGDHFRVLDGNPAGTYVFVTTFAGDDRVGPFITPVQDAVEQVLISAPEIAPVENPNATPEINTASLAQTGLPGKTIGVAVALLLLAGGGLLALNRYRKL